MAASNVPNFTLNRLYLDNTSVYQSTSQTINTPISVGSGYHSLILMNYNSGGKSFSSLTKFTVLAMNTGSCFPMTAYGVNICSPHSRFDEPLFSLTVALKARVVAQSGNITAIRAYVDNVAIATVNNFSPTNFFQVDTPINRLVLVFLLKRDGGAAVLPRQIAS